MIDKNFLLRVPSRISYLSSYLKYVCANALVDGKTKTLLLRSTTSNGYTGRSLNNMVNLQTTYYLYVPRMFECFMLGNTCLTYLQIQAVRKFTWYCNYCNLYLPQTLFLYII